MSHPDHVSRKELKGFALQGQTVYMSQRYLQIIFSNPLSTQNKSYMKDTTHFLKIIRDSGIVPLGCHLVTVNIDSLYTNIDIPTGIQEAKK